MHGGGITIACGLTGLVGAYRPELHALGGKPGLLRGHVPVPCMCLEYKLVVRPLLQLKRTALERGASHRVVGGMELHSRHRYILGDTGSI